MNIQFPCPCCGFLTLAEPAGGTYYVCPVCYLEDDYVQFVEPNFESGANKESLEQARQNFLTFGACSLRFIECVRPLVESEKPKSGISKA